MKINESTAILTPSILLVPYCEHHVKEYHRWMQNEDLQRATASEPLTLSEEYAMQKSWRSDTDKLTFIACLAPSHPSDQILAGRDDVPDKMLGDVNLFLYPGEANEDEAVCVGEVEIMIARPSLQNRGLGTKILLAFLRYVFVNLEGIEVEYSKTIKYLRVKIDAGNERSLKLFERVGFARVREEPNYFNEVELRLEMSDLSEKLVLEDVPRVFSFSLEGLVG